MENGFVDRGQRVFIIIYFYCFLFFSFYLLSRWSSVRSSLILQSLVDCPPASSPENHQHLYFSVLKIISFNCRLFLLIRYLNLTYQWRVKFF